MKSFIYLYIFLSSLQLASAQCPLLEKKEKHVCASEISVPLDGIITSEKAGYSSSGSGSFIPSSAYASQVSYNLSVADRQKGNVTLYLKTSASPNCPAKIDSSTIYIDPVITVDAGPEEIAVCAETQLSSSVFPKGNSSYWTNNTGLYDYTPEIYYTPSDDELNTGYTYVYLKSASGNSNVCPIAVDSIRINYLSPKIIVSHPDSMCELSSVTLEAQVENYTGFRWAFSDDGIIQSKDTDTKITFTDTDKRKINYLMISVLTSNQTCNRTMYIKINKPLKTYTTILKEELQCYTPTQVPLQGRLTYGSSMLWKTSGTGTFTNEQSAQSGYFPSAQDFSHGKVSIVLIPIDGTSTCGSISDTLSLVFAPAPILNVVRDTTVTCANFTLKANGKNCYHAFWEVEQNILYNNIPDSANTSFTYTASRQQAIGGELAVILEVRSKDYCQFVRDTILVHLKTPLYIAGDPKILCPGDTTAIPFTAEIRNTTDFRWRTSGSGAFIPSDKTLNASYRPSQQDLSAGKVWIILDSTAAMHCGYKDSIAISYNAKQLYGMLDMRNNKEKCYDYTFEVYYYLSPVENINKQFKPDGAGKISAIEDAQFLYTPSQEEYNKGFSTIGMEANAPGYCPFHESTTINYVKGRQIDLDAGPDRVCQPGDTLFMQSICNVDLPVYWQNIGLGTFSTQNGNGSLMYIPSSDYASGDSLYFVAMTSPMLECERAYDTCIISFNNDISIKGTARLGGQTINGLVNLYSLNGNTYALFKSTSFTSSYSFISLPEGKYLLQVIPDTLVKNQIPSILPTYYLSSPLWNEANALDVLPSKHIVADVNMLHSQITDSMWISGQYTIAGNIIDGGSNLRLSATADVPLIVYLRNAYGTLINYNYKQQGRKFLFNDLPAGKYKIQVDRVGYAVTTLDVSVGDDNSIVKEVNVVLKNIVLNTENGILEKIKIYPNPAEEILNIDFINTKGTGKAALMTLNGTILRETVLENAAFCAISLENIASGIYILKITDAGADQYFKISKK